MAVKKSVASSGSVQIDLSRPLDIDGAKIGYLTMREPTVGDQMAAAEIGGSDADQEVGLIANLCQVTPSDIKKMPLRDYQKVKAAFMSFID